MGLRVVSTTCHDGVPICMHDKQFPVGKLRGSSFAKCPTTLTDSDLSNMQSTSWKLWRRTSEYSPESMKQFLITNLSNEAIDLHEFSEEFSLRVLVATGIRGDDIYNLSKHINTATGVWALQVLARYVEAQALDVPLVDVPLINPLLGLGFDARQHDLLPNIVPDARISPTAIAGYDRWFYLLSYAGETDLIST